MTGDLVAAAATSLLHLLRLLLVRPPVALVTRAVVPHWLHRISRPWATRHGYQRADYSVGDVLVVSVAFGAIDV